MKKTILFLIAITMLIVAGCSKDELPIVEAPEQLQMDVEEEEVVEDKESQESNEEVEEIVLFSKDDGDSSEEKSEGIYGEESNSIGFGGSDTSGDKEEGISSASMTESQVNSIEDVKQTFSGTIVDAGMEDDTAMFMIESLEGAMVFIIDANTYMEESAMNISMGDVVRVGFSGETLGGNPPHAIALTVEGVEVDIE